MNIVKENIRLKFGNFYHFKGNPPPIGVHKIFPIEYDNNKFDGYVYTDNVLSDDEIKKYNLSEEIGDGWIARIEAEEQYDEIHDFSQEIINKFNQDGVVICTANGDYGIVYTPSSREGYQATYFGNSGFIGHIHRDTLEQTIKDAWKEYGRDYIQFISPEEFNAMTKNWDKVYSI